MFVGMMGLETGFSEGKDYNLAMCWAHDHLDAFPQSMVNNYSTMPHCLASYVSCLCISFAPHPFALT